jgi:hypothetical protein
MCWRLLCFCILWRYVCLQFFVIFNILLSTCNIIRFANPNFNSIFLLLLSVCSCDDSLLDSCICLLNFFATEITKEDQFSLCTLMSHEGFLEVLCKYLTSNIWFVCCSLKWTSSSEVGPFILARICSLIFVSSHKAKYLYSIPSKYQIFSSRDLRISFFIFHYCQCLFLWLWTSRESWSVFLQFWKILVSSIGCLDVYHEI